MPPKIDDLDVRGQRKHRDDTDNRDCRRGEAQRDSQRAWERFQFRFIVMHAAVLPMLDQGDDYPETCTQGQKHHEEQGDEVIREARREDH